jgi:hypothetical protein
MNFYVFAHNFTSPFGLDRLLTLDSELLMDKQQWMRRSGRTELDSQTTLVIALTCVCLV